MEKIKMNRTELLKAFKAVMPSVGGCNDFQGADTFILSPGLVQAYDDHLSITYPANVEVTAAVKATEMVRVLEKMGGLEITMEVDDAALRITDGRTTLTMKKIDTEAPSLIQALDLEGLEWDTIPDGFLKALSLCIPSTSNNPAHGVLCGVRVDGEDLLSSDNFRATWTVLGVPMKPFTLPAPAASNLLKVPGLESYAVTPSWVHFANKDGVVFSARLYSNEYPADSLKQLFPSEDDSQTYKLPEELKAALGRASVLSSTQADSMEFVTISKKGKDLLVEGQRQAGSVVDKIPVGDDGFPPEVKININPKFLLDIMEITREFRLVGNLLVFSGDGFLYLTSTVSL